MMRYSVQTRDGHLSFAKNMGKNISKNVSKSLSGKYSPGMLAACQKLLDHAKQSATDALKTSSKRVIQIAAEPTGHFANKVAKTSKNLQQNNLETVTNENDKEIPQERYIS